MNNHSVLELICLRYQLSYQRDQGSSYAGRGRPPLTISARHNNNKNNFRPCVQFFFFFFFFLVPFFAKDTHHMAREHDYFLKNVRNLYIATLLVAQP